MIILCPKRFHSEAMIQATELLLQERLPESTPATPQQEGEQVVTERLVKGMDQEKNQFIILTTARVLFQSLTAYRMGNIL